MCEKRKQSKADSDFRILDDNNENSQKNNKQQKSKQKVQKKYKEKRRNIDLRTQFSLNLPPSSSPTGPLMTIPLEFIEYRGLLSREPESIFVQQMFGFGFAVALQLILSPELPRIKY